MSEGRPDTVRIIVDLAGALAVLLGLVFVGLELRQNTAAISAQAVFDLNNVGNESHRLLAQDASLESLVHRGNEDPTALSEEELRRFSRWMRVRFNGIEAAWFYQSKGLLTEAESSGFRGSACDALASEGGSWFWNAEIGNYAEGFVADIEDWCFD